MMLNFSKINLTFNFESGKFRKSKILLKIFILVVSIIEFFCARSLSIDTAFLIKKAPYRIWLISSEPTSSSIRSRSIFF